ncbi:EAL domain-containing protein [Massilia pinisoli]|uniref:EAL domain-containing protein n=1 Tax=Massilia pinisoli TaxID=1772194 RepID=A0ABT1ZJX1_9BURK|nr:EAL domain-containing protein [Massilia pinisoli]MCS0580187.1 EAL domain-containing protein [Massilia pinisoli]
MLTRKVRLGRARPRPPTPAAVLTLLAGLGLTAVLVVGMVDAERERARSEFLQRAEIRNATVTRSFGDALDVLQAANALFSSVGIATRAEFGAFAQPLLANHPYLQGVVFHRMVSSAERPAFEAENRRFRPDFEIRERRVRGGEVSLVRAAPRPRYLVVDYIEPMRGNEVTLGYDTFSFAPHGSTFMRAIDTARPASSQMLPLLQRGDHLGFHLIMPVYRRDAPLDNAAARSAAALGDTAVIIDVATLVGSTLEKSNMLNRSGLKIELYGPGMNGPQRAYLHDSLDKSLQPAWQTWFGDAVFTNSHPFLVAGMPWELRVTGRSSAMAGGAGPLMALILGCLVSMATSAYVQSRVKRTRRIEALVESRTSDLHEALDALRLYRRAIDASANAVILVSATRPGYPVEYVNPAYERIRAYAAADVIGRGLAELGAREPDQAAVAELRAAIRERREGHVSMRLSCGDGRDMHAEVYIAPVNNDDGVTTHFVMTQYDVTMAKRYEAELEARARFDTLTGLANRSLLHDRIDNAINMAAGRGAVWVAALDLDHFKFVNDTLGHDAGDQLLKTAAQRISAAVERADTVARTGGDEFVLVLPGRDNESDAAATVRAVLQALAHPLELSGQDLVLTGSAGLAAYPADGSDAATLIQHAEVAMYRSKELGRNMVQFYMPTMNARARERLALEGALRSALLHDEFELYYQPQVDLESGVVVGFEALIRWRHPSMGMVRPDRFINLAEETGLIVPIGAWVLRTACRQNRAWQHAGFGPLRIAVNLSARQFAEPNLVPEIARVLDETGLSASCLEVEITESLVMGDVESAIRTMRELKLMGVKLSIDDFGTGYSSLSYLRRFPVDVLKIDRSFVRDIPFDEDDAAMVAAIIELARGLRMRVIAEGVETEAQLDYLRRRGCDEVQGHVYAQASSGADVERLLRMGRHMLPHNATV